MHAISLIVVVSIGERVAVTVCSIYHDEDYRPGGVNRFTCDGAGSERRKRLGYRNCNHAMFSVR